MTTKEHSQDAGLVPGSPAPEPRLGHSLQRRLLDVTKQLKILHTKILDTQDCSGQRAQQRSRIPSAPKGAETGIKSGQHRQILRREKEQGSARTGRGQTPAPRGRRVDERETHDPSCSPGGSRENQRARKTSPPSMSTSLCQPSRVSGGQEGCAGVSRAAAALSRLRLPGRRGKAGPGHCRQSLREHGRGLSTCHRAFRLWRQAGQR